MLREQRARFFLNGLTIYVRMDRFEALESRVAGVEQSVATLLGLVLQLRATRPSTSKRSSKRRKRLRR